MPRRRRGRHAKKDQGLCWHHGKLSVPGQLVSRKVNSHQPEPRLNENQAALRFARLAEEGGRFERDAVFGGVTGLS